MFKIGKITWFLVFVIVFVIAVFSANMILGQADPFFEIQEKLKGISAEEKEILQNLFLLTQDIESMEKEEEKLAEEIRGIKEEISDMKFSIDAEEKIYEKNKEALRQVLKSYQRMGPGSYLEILLDSDNLAMFLRNINTLLDMSCNTGELLDGIEKSKEKLLAGKDKLDKKLLLIEDKQEELKETYIKKVKLKEEKEEYLTSLKGEKEYYIEYLANLQQAWNYLRDTFSQASVEFSRIMEEEDIPEDAIKLSFSFFSIRGTIDEKTLNDIIKNHGQLPNMVFRFIPGKMEIEFPNNNLVLKGGLIIGENNVVKFEAEEGSLYGMTLGKQVMEELFSEEGLVINLKPLLGDNILESIDIKEGFVELLITPKFWKENNND